MSKRAPRAPAPRRDRKAETSTSKPEVGSDEQIQQTLDEALADSFPASDPVSIVTSQHEEAWKKDRKPD